MELKRHRICIDQYRGSPQWVDGRNSQNFPAAPEARPICRTTPNKIFKLHSGRPIPLIFGDIQSANDIARMRPRLRRYNNLLGVTFLQRGRSDGAEKDEMFDHDGSYGIPRSPRRIIKSRSIRWFIYAKNPVLCRTGL